MRCIPLFLLCSLLIQATACQKSTFNRGDTSYAPPLQAPVTPPTFTPIEILPDTPQPLFQDCEKAPDRMMQAELFQLPKDTPRLPDFSRLDASKTLCLKQLDITDRDFTEGFPGVDNVIEWFGLNIRFKLLITTPGNYEFALNSDDGSRLFIDEQELIDNDGQHSDERKVGSRYLAAGVHPVRLPYFQGPRYRIALELKWKKPGDTEVSYIPLTAIQRPE